MKQGLLISGLVLSLSIYGQTTHIAENESVNSESQSISTPPTSINTEAIQNVQALDIKRIERPIISEKKATIPAEKKAPINN